MYLVLDASVTSHARLLEIAKEAVNAGVDIIQLRDKNSSDEDFVRLAKRIALIASDTSLFIINDRIHLMDQINPNGVHLGQDDFPLSAARALVGEGKLIGISCQTLAHALKAQEEGADYIGFGSVFKTKTKPERSAMDQKLLKSVIDKIRIPAFAIGGIDAQNAPPLIAVGVQRIALTRAIMEAEDVSKAVKDLREVLDQREIAGVVQW